MSLAVVFLYCGLEHSSSVERIGVRREMGEYVPVGHEPRGIKIDTM